MVEKPKVRGDDKKDDELKDDSAGNKGEGKTNKVPIPRYAIEYVHYSWLFRHENPNAYSRT